MPPNTQATLEKENASLQRRVAALEKELARSKQVEDGLRKSEGFFRFIAEHSPNTIFVQDRELRYEWLINSISDTPPDEYLGKTDLELFPPDQAVPLTELKKKILQTGEKQHVEVKLDVDGVTRWHDAIYQPVRDQDGQVIGVAGYVRDITARKQAEERLRESESLLKEIAANYPNSYVSIIEKDLSIGFTSGEEFKKQGLDPAQFVGLTLEQVLGEHAPLVRDNCLKTFDGIKTQFELSINNQFQSYRTVPLKNQQGRIERILAVVENITERKRVEEELSESKYRYQQLFENINTGVAVYEVVDDGRDFIFKDFNRAGERIDGDSRERLIGKSIFEVRPGIEEFGLLEILRQVWRTGQPVHHPEKQYTDNQLTGWYENYVYRISPKEIVAVFENITERKQAEEERAKLTERLDLAARSAGIGIWDWDIVKNEIVWDDQMYALYGLEPGEFGGAYEAWLRGIHPDDRESSNEVSAAAVRGEQVYDTEFRVLWRDGSIHWLKANGEVFRDRYGKPIRMVGVNYDITDRKQAELEKQKFFLIAESSSEFIGMCDLNMHPLYVNPAGIRMVGLPGLEAACRVQVQDYFYPEDQKFIEEELFPRVLRDGQGDMEIRFRHFQTGKPIWMFYYLFSVRDAGNNIIGWATVSRDITERKQAEETIRRQVEYLTALREIDLSIASSFDLRVTLDQIVLQAIQKLNVDAAAVFLFDPMMNDLKFAAGHGFRSHAISRLRVPLGKDFAGEAALTRRPVSVPDLSAVESKLPQPRLTAGEDFTAYYATPLIAKGKLVGVLEVFRRATLYCDDEWQNFMFTLAGQAAIAIDSIQLFDNVQRSNFDLVAAYDDTIMGWSRALDLRDKETEGHTQRVTDLTSKLAARMGISPADMVHVRRGALLHDIGKLGIPDHILLKPGTLTDEEYAIMRQHPVFAFNLLSPITYLRPALDIPYCHHEKWDGTGYPRGLRGELIPLAARIFAIVDVWDALRSDRPYRRAWGLEETLRYIRTQTGLHFDPQVVVAFLRLLDEMGGPINLA